MNQLLNQLLIETVLSNLFDMALRGLTFTKNMRTKLYDFFVEKTIQDSQNMKTKSTLYKTKDYIDNQVVETINKFAENYVLAQEETITSLKNGTSLDEKIIKRLMWWWNKNYLYRRLFMLGVTRTEIKNCVERGWSICDLYYQLVENPYILEKINIETCNKISKKYEKDFTYEIIQCGLIVREIDVLSNERCWVCTPINMILQKYPNFLPSTSSTGLIKKLEESLIVK